MAEKCALNSKVLHEACRVSLKFGETSINRTIIFEEKNPMKERIISKFNDLIACIEDFASEEHCIPKFTRLHSQPNWESLSNRDANEDQSEQSELSDPDQSQADAKSEEQGEELKPLQPLQRLQSLGGHDDTLKLRFETNDVFSITHSVLDKSLASLFDECSIEGTDGIYCTKTGNAWPPQQRGETVMVYKDFRDVKQTDTTDATGAKQEKAIYFTNLMQPVDVIGGVAAGLKDWIFALRHPVSAAKDLVVKPVTHAKTQLAQLKNGDASDASDARACGKVEAVLKGVGSGVGEGLKSFGLRAPVMMALDLVDGAGKIVDGVFNTPMAWYNVHVKKQDFNPWIGWTSSYKVSELDAIPGRTGDILAIFNHWYWHIMLKFDDQHVIHRYGGVSFSSQDISEFQAARAEVMLTSLKELQRDYPHQMLTIASSDYCIVYDDDCKAKERKFRIYKARNEAEIVKVCKAVLNDKESGVGWSAIRKNCEHLCFFIKYDLNMSPQIEMMKHVSDCKEYDAFEKSLSRMINKKME